MAPQRKKMKTGNIQEQSSNQTSTLSTERPVQPPPVLQDDVCLKHFTLLQATRHLQSPFVKHCTETNDMKEAIGKGNLDNVKWIWENNTNWEYYEDVAEYFTLAISLGHFEIVKWLHEVKCPEGEYTCSYDRVAGTYSANAMSMAADFGNLKMMKWMNEKGYAFDNYTFVRALRNGNMENLKWLKEMECEWGERYAFCWVYNDALVYNWSLEKIIWANKNGFRFDEDSYVAAAEWGNVRYMQWLKKNKVPMDARCYRVATEHYDMDWLKENDCQTSLFAYSGEVEHEGAIIRKKS